MPPSHYDATTLDLYYRTALAVLQPRQIRLVHDQPAAPDRSDNVDDRPRSLDPATNISIVLQNLGLSDTTGLMWENLCQTAAHAADTKRLKDSRRIAPTGDLAAIRL